MSFINAYLAAFQSAYPQKKVDVRTVGNNQYKVVINGDAGDLVMSEFDMRLATRAFQGRNAGRVYHAARAPLSQMARFVS